MELLRNWYGTANKVVRHPKEFFASIPKDDLNTAFKFAIISYLLSAIISLPISLLFLGKTIMSGILNLVLVPISGIIGIIIVGVILHILLYIVGARKGFAATLSVLAYLSIFGVILSIFEYFVFLTGFNALIMSISMLLLSLPVIYGLYVSIVGYSIIHEISKARVLIVFIPVIILALILIVAGLVSTWLTASVASVQEAII